MVSRSPDALAILRTPQSRFLALWTVVVGMEITGRVNEKNKSTDNNTDFLLDCFAELEKPNFTNLASSPKCLLSFLLVPAAVDRSKSKT